MFKDTLAHPGKAVSVTLQAEEVMFVGINIGSLTALAICMIIADPGLLSLKFRWPVPMRIGYSGLC